MILQLRTKGFLTLKQIAEAVPEGEDVNDLVTQMFMVMRQHRGIGLAANQVGVLKRVIVIEVNGLVQEFVNPVITPLKKGRATSREGCLSFPGERVPMVRHRAVMIEGFTRDWTPIQRKLKDLAAYCVQHEVDHLNGVTIA